MSNKIIIKTDYGINAKTGLSQELCFESLNVNKSGYVNLTMAVDILDNEGNVFVTNHGTVKNEVHAQAQHAGAVQIPPTEITPRMEALIVGVKGLIEAYMEGETNNG